MPWILSRYNRRPLPRIVTALVFGVFLAGLSVAVTSRAPLHAQAQPSGNQWQFEDEEEQTPGWGEIVRTQAVDLAVFAGFTVLALVSFFRKSRRLKYVTLAACVVLLGFWKSQLITIVNIFGLLSLDLPIFKYNLAWYLLATFTVVSTVLWGRLYCGRMCAFGALTQLMDVTLPASWRREPPAWLERRAAYVKYGILVAAILYFLVTRDRFIYRYIEPFWMFGLHGSVVMWSLLAALLVATVFVRNVYCRLLCPVGAALGVISQVTTVFSIKRWKECNTCKICEKACEWGAIQGPKIVKSECVRCDDCERLYADTQKCPHWIIIRRRSDFKERPSVVPAP
jgi:NosR/NirI family transcriptional regulator, nitrous oxide reductase regulator